MCLSCQVHVHVHTWHQGCSFFLQLQRINSKETIRKILIFFFILTLDLHRNCSCYQQLATVVEQPAANHNRKTDQLGSSSDGREVGLLHGEGQAVPGEDQKGAFPPVTAMASPSLDKWDKPFQVSSPVICPPDTAVSTDHYSHAKKHPTEGAEYEGYAIQESGGTGEFLLIIWLKVCETIYYTCAPAYIIIYP